MSSEALWTDENIGRIAASKSQLKKDALQSLYRDMLERVRQLLQRSGELVKTIKNESCSPENALQTVAIEHWINLTEQVSDTARRRVLLGAKVPNCDKLSSMFETHTQLYRRGKAGQVNQYGRLVLVFEDNAGFISHYHLMDREATLLRHLKMSEARVLTQKHIDMFTSPERTDAVLRDDNRVVLNTGRMFFERGIHSMTQFPQLSWIKPDQMRP